MARTYAGFGYPNEEPTLRSVIKADGGTGDFTSVTLDTAAYEALYAKRADFVITFSAWEGVEAARRGIDPPDLRVRRLRVPGLLPGGARLRPALAGARTGARPGLRRGHGRGFDLAVATPTRPPRLLIAQNPGVFDGDPDLPAASQQFLTDGGYLRDEPGPWARQTLERWTGYSGFLYDQGLLVGPDGKPLTAPPDYAALFTNDFLP